MVLHLETWPIPRRAAKTEALIDGIDALCPDKGGLETSLGLGQTTTRQAKEERWLGALSAATLTAERIDALSNKRL